LKKSASQETRAPQLLPGEERRRSQRVMLRVPVTVRLEVAGQKVTVQANTVSINDHGAMLLCVRSFSLDSKLEIENDRTHEKQPCRVTRTAVESPEGYLIPVEFAKPAPGFWRISFPPTDWKPLED
jgi:hypothetical protein